MGLLLPLGLLALAALALPIAIHLLRRPEDRVIPFAAWRYLSRERLPRERLRIREWLLLALRLLLIATLALLISMPVRNVSEKPAVQWIAVSPHVPVAVARAALNRPNAQWHWLQAGFASLDESPASSVDLSLLRELDAQLAPNDKLAVIVPQRLSGLDAIRPELSREIEWIVVPGTAEPAPALPRVVVRHDAESAAELSTIEALRVAWQAAGRPVDFDVAPQTKSFDPRAQLLVWLGGEPSPEALRWVGEGGTLLQTRAGQGEWPLHAVAQGQGRIFSLSTAFDPASTPGVAEAAFATTLREQLLRPARVPDSADADGFKPAQGAMQSIIRKESLDEWLIWIAALLFLVERSCAALLARRAHA